MNAVISFCLSIAATPVIQGPALPADAKPVFVVLDGAKIRKTPDKLGEVLREARYGEQFWLLQSKAVDGGRSFVQCSTSAPGGTTAAEPLGWLDAADALLKVEAFREKGIYTKGLIVNTWRASRDTTSIEGAQVLNGPGTRPNGNAYDKVQELTLFKFYFIYDRRDDATTGKQFLLLGNTPKVVRKTNPKETLLGWVDSARIKEWNTRQSVEIDKTTLKARTEGIAPELAGAQIFEDKRELVAFLKGETEIEGNPILPVAKETITVTAWPHYLQRYPLFATDRIEGLESAGVLYKIGFIGDQVYVSGDTGVTADVLASNSQQLETLKNEMRRMEILFVIDGTGSMYRFYDAAASAVQQITNSISARREGSPEIRPEVRYSVAFYRDYVDYDGIDGNPDDTFLVKRLPITGDSAQVARFIQDERNIPDGAGGDAPEAVYQGILEAISRATEELYENSFKCVILIGDAGNHPNDPKGHTAQKVAEALKAQRIDFYSVQVVAEEEIASSPAAAYFRDQTKSIREALLSENSYGVQTMAPEEIAAQIINVSTIQAENVSKNAQMIDELQSGASTLVDLKGKYGLQLTENLTKIMESKGINVRAYIEKSVQIFDEGWVCQLDPHSSASQVREIILVDRADFEILMGIMSGFIKDPPTHNTVLNVWGKVLSDQIGEAHVAADKSIAEQIQAHLGLPVQRNILHKSINEIGAMPVEELENVWLDLKYDLYRMRGIHAERTVELTRTDANIETKDLGDRPVWWSAGGTDYGWIPLSEMP